MTRKAQEIMISMLFASENARKEVVVEVATEDGTLIDDAQGHDHPNQGDVAHRLGRTGGDLLHEPKQIPIFLQIEVEAVAKEGGAAQGPRLRLPEIQLHRLLALNLVEGIKTIAKDDVGTALGLPRFHHLAGLMTREGHQFAVILVLVQLHLAPDRLDHGLDRGDV